MVLQAIEFIETDWAIQTGHMLVQPRLQPILIKQSKKLMVFTINIQ